MIYKILLDHKKLEEERNPDKNVNKVTKGFLLFYMLFWIGYLLLIGTMLPFAFEGIFPNMEPYNIFNGWMITVFALDFLIRFSYQKAPSQNIKGYILYPIGKQKLVNFMILYSLKRWMNLLWLFFTVPFIYLSTVRFFGVAATLHYNICFMILILCNDLFFSISKTLMNKHILWLLLPLSFFGLTVGLLFLPDSPLYKFYMDFGEGMITGSWWTYAASLLLLAAPLVNIDIVAVAADGIREIPPCAVVGERQFIAPADPPGFPDACQRGGLDQMGPGKCRAAAIVQRFGQAVSELAPPEHRLSNRFRIGRVKVEVPGIECRGRRSGQVAGQMHGFDIRIARVGHDLPDRAGRISAESPPGHMGVVVVVYVGKNKTERARHDLLAGLRFNEIRSGESGES